MRQGDRLAVEVVRWAKGQMVAGVHPRAIARHLRVSMQTILRMRDGETYNGEVYWVAGEEGLRPALTFNPRESPIVERPVVSSFPLVPMSAEEVRASEDRLMAFQEGLVRDKAQPAPDVEGVPDWLQATVKSAGEQGRP